jgi:hypothetical protein
MTWGIVIGLSIFALFIGAILLFASNPEGDL